MAFIKCNRIIILRSQLSTVYLAQVHNCLAYFQPIFLLFIGVKSTATQIQRIKSVNVLKLWEKILWQGKKMKGSLIIGILKMLRMSTRAVEDTKNNLKNIS